MLVSKTMKKIWKTFLEAIHGAEHDYTEGSISKAVILLGVPMVLEMVMESVFAITDIFFVGKLGPQAIATIGLTESLLTVVYTLAFGLSIGASAMISRRVGEKDLNGAAITAVQTLLIGTVVSILITLIGTVFATDLLRLMGATEDVVEYGVNYMRVMFAGNIVILLLFLGNAIVRGAGDGALAMRALWIANGINVLLVPCFVYGFLIIPAFGVTGAAIATTVSRGIGATYTLWHLFSGSGRIKVFKRHFAINLELIKRILALSGSGTLQVFIGTASWIGLVRVMSTFGSEAVAGYTVGFRIILFALFPAFGLGNAAATMMGQSLGAGKPERAEKAVWLAAFYNMIFLGFMGVIFITFAPEIIDRFTTDQAVHDYATSCLRIVSSGFLLYAFGMVLSQSFNGAGDTWTPTIINFFVFWLFEIPVAYILSTPVGMGPKGVFLAVTLSFSTMAIVCAVVFRKGKWKTKKV